MNTLNNVKVYVMVYVIDWEQSLPLKMNFLDIDVLLQCVGLSLTVRNTGTKSVIACSACEAFFRYLQSCLACCSWPEDTSYFRLLLLM